MTTAHASSVVKWKMIILMKPSIVRYYNLPPLPLSPCSTLFCRCSGMRGMRPTNWLCFGMWISGGHQRIIRHDCSMWVPIFTFSAHREWCDYFLACSWCISDFLSIVCVCRNMIVCNPLRISLSLVGAHVLETWLTCVCWHVTWNTWIVSIQIACKCLFNTRFTSFYSTCACWEIPKSCLPALRYATHWLIVIGMWLSGGYQRTIRHDNRA